jgi:pimeloyl-ACP methyl ester carboxylesterase
MSLIPLAVQVPLLVATTLYQLIACWRENKTPAPGQLADVGGFRLHYLVADASSESPGQAPDGPAQPTIIFEHSLGGVEGYLLIDELAKLSRVMVYDRAGYGWSDHSPRPRTSSEIVQELDALLTAAKIAPPYVLVGDSFGSYTVRLYAHQFPEKIKGMVLTDALHETGMLNMPIQLQALKWFFLSGFWMSIPGSILGIIRSLRTLGCFELLKPELRSMPKPQLNRVKRSFCRAKHWITMSRELLNLDYSSRQLQVAQFFNFPIVSIKSHSFFKPSFWTLFVPLKATNRLRDQMHLALGQLSPQFEQIPADESSHFVWVDQPELIIQAVKTVLAQSAETGDA